jgi:neutral amino acid transport system permease protein
MVVTPFLVLLSSRSADALSLCLPKPNESGCIAGTLGSRSTPIADVDVILTKPDGSTETQTTGKDGRFSFQVTEAGEYLVGLDADTIPKGYKYFPPSESSLRGKGDTLKVTAQLGKTVGASVAIRPDDYSDSTSKASEAVQSAFNGLRLGLLLALASVGLSLIYGTTGLSNFAHAEQVTFGGMLGYGFVNVLGLNLWLGGVIVVLIGALSGFTQDRLLWQPLRRRGLGLTQLMIVTIGLSLAIQYCFQYFVGSRTVRVVVSSSKAIDFGPISTTLLSITAMLISAVVLVLVGLALTRSRIGRATRAVSDNPALAQASGIDTDKVIRLVWTVAMGLAALSGLLYALVTNGVKWDTGLQILLLLFASVTLGGLGTAFGALIGSIVIGLVVEMSPLVIPGDFKYAAALLILILLLVVRPQGLLGKAQRVG